MLCLLEKRTRINGFRESKNSSFVLTCFYFQIDKGKVISARLVNQTLRCERVKQDVLIENLFFTLLNTTWHCSMHLSGSEKPFRSAQSGAVLVCKAQNKPCVEPNQPQEPPSSFRWEYTTKTNLPVTSAVLDRGSSIQCTKFSSSTLKEQQKTNLRFEPFVAV